VFAPEKNQVIKLHKTLLNGIATALSQIFNENRYSDKVLERLFKQNKQWGSRDRKFVAEAVYDIVRYYRLLSHLAESKNNFWFITAVYLVLKEIELPDWPEFKHVNKQLIQNKFNEAKSNFALFQSYPDNINELCIKEVGKDTWEREAAAMNEIAEVVIRVNTLKTNSKKLQEELAKDDIESYAIQHVPNALGLKKRSNIFSNRNFKDGLFELQDSGSQEIGLCTGAEPKQTAIDACAGAGGKSLQLAALMQNKGRIISMDVTQWKLDELNKRAKRAGVHNLETRLIEGSKTISALKDKADVLLLDVPCSGLGVLKRNPDTKWKFNKEIFDKTRTLQQQILSEYAVMVKPGGTLVYSTCSILPSENREQVNTFLQNNKIFEFVDDRTIYPSEGYDGFYMCKLKRKNSI
jgi:16S rRNA (cytosine967-C5)-methyltransferase